MIDWKKNTKLHAQSTMNGDLRVLLLTTFTTVPHELDNDGLHLEKFNCNWFVNVKQALSGNYTI